MEIGYLNIKEAAFFEFSNIEDQALRKALESAFYFGAKFAEQVIKERLKQEGKIENLTKEPALN